MSQHSTYAILAERKELYTAVMNRLINEECNGAGERYAYDLCGNRLLKEQYSGSSVDVIEGYRYNEKNELTERIQSTGKFGKEIFK